MSSPTRVTAISDIAQLEDLLSEPTDQVVGVMSRLRGDVMLLGAGGKMGPTLARMARRASDAAGVDRRVIAVSRFSTPPAASHFKDHGIETIACDLLDPQQLERLPDCENIVHMAVLKFGSTGREGEAWATNCYLPALVCQKFRESRIVAFSTGNVYGLTPVQQGGSRETDVPQPVGEYGMSCLGRERMFEYFSTKLNIPVAILRLNYACELRYGVLVDLAEKVWAEKPIDLAMGYFNIIWQGDANAMTLAAFDRCATPAAVFNMTGPELLDVRGVCDEFGRLFGKQVHYRGEIGEDALLSNCSLSEQHFAPPRIPAAELIEAVAVWIQQDGARLGKPTKFEQRDGRF